jgi:hypothetical protein
VAINSPFRFRRDHNRATRIVGEFFTGSDRNGAFSAGLTVSGWIRCTRCLSRRGTLHLDEIERLPGPGTLTRLPVRAELGVRALTIDGEDARRPEARRPREQLDRLA